MKAKWIAATAALSAMCLLGCAKKPPDLSDIPEPKPPPGYAAPPQGGPAAPGPPGTAPKPPAPPAKGK
ncbi:MAG: hypothetical protein FJX72_07960 [Armatimonadetes bacterium]|nr:hypothetical protein [Armatimonadota bacterium]